MSQHVCPQELQGSCQFNTNRQHLLHRFPKCHVVFLKKNKENCLRRMKPILRAWMVLEVSQTAPDTSPGCGFPGSGFPFFPSSGLAMGTFTLHTQ